VLNPKEKSYRDHWELIKREKVSKAQSQQAAMQKFFSKGVYNEKAAAKVMKEFDKLPNFSPENP
jgi:hypothetical protein